MDIIDIINVDGIDYEVVDSKARETIDGVVEDVTELQSDVSALHGDVTEIKGDIVDIKDNLEWMKNRIKKNTKLAKAGL